MGVPDFLLFFATVVSEIIFDLLPVVTFFLRVLSLAVGVVVVPPLTLIVSDVAPVGGEEFVEPTSALAGGKLTERGGRAGGAGGERVGTKLCAGSVWP